MANTEPSSLPNWTGVLYGLGLSTLAAYHQFKMAPVLSEMAIKFSYSPLLSGSFMSIYAVAGLILARWMGNHMHDKDVASFIRNILILSLLGAILGLLLPQSDIAMFIARAMEGIGACGLSIAGPAVIFRFMRPEQQGLAASIGALWIPLGVILASLLALWPDKYLGILDHQWQLNWIVSIGMSLLLILSTMFYQKNHVSLTRQHKPAPDENGHMTSLWDSQTHRICVILTALTFAFWSCQNIAFMSWLPSYLAEDLGYQQEQAALIFIAPMAFLGLFNVLAAPLMRIFGATCLLTAAILGQGLSAYLILYTFTSEELIIQFILLVVYGSLAGVTPSCLYRMPSLVLGQQSGTKAFGWVMSGRNVGVFSGPLIIAIALQFTETKWDSLGITIIAACLISAFVSLILMQKVKALTT
ncbi:MFS transporter [Curvivirga sp.]|uniref:MFS transporter n=1 Tax=Curvivirga sp. TaxID=2856848 RepID=UPI003B5A303C